MRIDRTIEGEHAVVVGAGIWGCTVARRLAEAGRKVLVLEKRTAVGGNCRCEIDPETGIEIHSYGSHIFHTKDKAVWDFVRRFADFNRYRHGVLANYRGKTYHLLIGCTLLKEFFGRDLKPSELNETDRAAIFEAFIRGYTSKQWGVPPEQVDPSVIARLKVRDTFSTDYFDDPWQGIPADGYNALFSRMLDHPNITVRTNAEFRIGNDERRNLKIYYSGPIDALFGCKFGPLPWRTLDFERETVNCRDFQGASVVNYTEAEVPYTRIHEFRHYHPESGGGLSPTVEQAGNLNSRTIIMREYSRAWKPGDEPYYPIGTAESAALLVRYQAELSALNSRLATLNSQLIAGGRLGAYKYYDMDQAVAAALKEMDLPSRNVV